MGDNSSARKNKKKKPKFSIVFKSVLGIVSLLIVFSVIVSVIGFKSFTDALLEQYSEGAFLTAKTAVMELDSDKMEEYAQSGGTTPDYQAALQSMEKLCNSSGATFIYVIRPDLTDYRHITFLFSTINEKSNYSRYEFGYVRETTNEEYMEKYRRLYEGVSDHELVIRDQGYIETDPHITAMVPVTDSRGKITAILCVQRQMDQLVVVRNSYIRRVVLAMAALMLLVIVGQVFYLHHVFLRPVRKITEEASRFSHENDLPDKKLGQTVRTRDEIGLLAGSIDRMEERIVRYVEDLTKATAEKERFAAELELATRIQTSMLPNIFPPFPEKKDIDLYASMDPAKEVGGDFYDFFFVDDDHLCLVIADVSGKGVPAALFMMSSKIILADYAKMGKSPAEILTAANQNICAGSHENMFVTVWLGILELSTGRLTAANAGHEYPALLQPEGSFELFKDRHGLVLGGFSGIRYREYTLDLKPGYRLFVYTDGVPEATDQDGQLFGTDRMLEALNRKPDASPQELLQEVRNAVDAFVRDAEQFDDLTMLCIEYRGTDREGQDDCQ